LRPNTKTFFTSFEEISDREGDYSKPFVFSHENFILLILTSIFYYFFRILSMVNIVKGEDNPEQRNTQLCLDMSYGFLFVLSTIAYDNVFLIVN